MLKSYQAGIVGMRWLVSDRNDADPVLQYALRPIHGGVADWFDVPTEVATLPSTPKAEGEGKREIISAEPWLKSDEVRDRMESRR